MILFSVSSKTSLITAGKLVPDVFNHLHPCKCPGVILPRQLFQTLLYLPHPCGRPASLQSIAKLPKIFYVNWFRKNEAGKFMWPGFGENSRVLKWIFERCNGEADAVETPIGNLPTMDAMDFSGLDIDDNDKAQLLRVEVDGWLQEIPLIKEYYEQFGDRLPTGLMDEVEQLQRRLEAAKQCVA